MSVAVYIFSSFRSTLTVGSIELWGVDLFRAALERIRWA